MKFGWTGLYFGEVAGPDPKSYPPPPNLFIVTFFGLKPLDILVFGDTDLRVDAGRLGDRTGDRTGEGGPECRLCIGIIICNEKIVCRC